MPRTMRFQLGPAAFPEGPVAREVVPPQVGDLEGFRGPRHAPADRTQRRLPVYPFSEYDGLLASRASRSPGKAISPNLMDTGCHHGSRIPSDSVMHPSIRSPPRGSPNCGILLFRSAILRRMCARSFRCLLLISMGTDSPVPAPVATLTITLCLNWCTEMNTSAGSHGARTQGKVVLGACAQ